jgi:biotin transport system permease protein
MLGSYLPGSSPLHRAPAGLKLAGLGAGLLALAVWRGPLPLAVAAAVVLLLAALARVRPRDAGRQLRPVLWVCVAVAALQLVLAGPQAALVVSGSLLAGVAAAALVTLTTRTADLLDVVARVLRPLRRLGVDPERVGLVLALAVRSVPVLAGLAAEVRDARRARGAERSMRAFAVPLVIRAVRHADRLGEALAARGVDDE